MLVRRKYGLFQQKLRAIAPLLSTSFTSTVRVQSQSTDAVPASPYPSAAASSSSSSSSSPPSADAGEEVDRKDNVLWRIIKGGIFLASSVVVGGTAYVSYAYKVEEVDQYLSGVRSARNLRPSEDVGLLKRISHSMYSSSVSGLASVAEFYLDVRKSIEDQVRGFSAPSSNKLLPDLLPQEQHVFTLVLDLNETLVYSDWKRDRGWRTFKRPGVEAFLEQLAQYYELVIYSDQLNFYVDPVLDRLDQKGCIRYRLSRDATQYIHGKHYRDISKLNRDPAKVMYLSGHALETCLQPENALPIKPWKLEGDDTCLLDLLPFLEYVSRNHPGDIRNVLASYQGQDIASEFRVRHKEYQRRMQERKQQSRFWRGSAISRPNQ